MKKKNEYNHYKDDNPTSTINKIKNFFESKGFEVKNDMGGKSEADTFYSHLSLTNQGKFFMGSNGKGITSEYNLASAYGELYERFYSKYQMLGNVSILNNCTDFSFAKYGYYFEKDEKKMSIDELCSSIKNSVSHRCLYELLDDVSTDEKEKIFNSIIGKNHIGIKYKELGGDTEKYFSYPLMMVGASNGLASGNSLEEALVQGISEIFERATSFEIPRNPIEVSKHCLNLENITNNDKIKNIINSIQKNGNSLYIFDASYLLGQPVLMSVVINKKNKIIEKNIGSHPVFDIALERVLTELYQGIKSYDEHEYAISSYQLLWRKCAIDEDTILNIVNESNKHAWGQFILNENILLNMRYEETYNHQAFLSDNNYDNKYLLDHINSLSKKNNFGSIFYHEFKNNIGVCAVNIIADNILNPLVFEGSIRCQQRYNIDNVKFNNYFVDATDFLGNFSYETDIKNIENCIKSGYEYCKKYNMPPFVLGGSKTFGICFGFSSSLCDIIGDIYDNKDNYIDYFLSKLKITGEKAKEILFIYDYYSCGKYSKDELIKLFNIVGINRSWDDITNIANIEYWIRLISISLAKYKQSIKNKAIDNIEKYVISLN